MIVIFSLYFDPAAPFNGGDWELNMALIRKTKPTPQIQSRLHFKG